MAASKRVAMRMWVRLRNAYRYLEDVLKPIIGDVVLDIEGKAINLTQDNIGQYTIHDVVLPLPGHSIVYPKYVNFLGANLILPGTRFSTT